MSACVNSDAVCAPHAGILEIENGIRHAREVSDNIRSLCADIAERSAREGWDELPQRFADRLQEILTDLSHFLFAHFVAEERLIKEIGLPEQDPERYAKHIEDHARIAARLRRLVDGLGETRTPTILDEVQTLVERWYAEHIREHDLAILPAASNS
jgi:hemerythrin-like metal-binding protein